jgi:peptide/nickel transport system substrate-binding protein
MKLALLAGSFLALVVLGQASARTYTASRYGGTLVVGLSAGDPNSLDPTLARGLSGAEILDAMCAKLYEQGDGDELLPRLAATLPVLSRDKLSYTIQLRHGILFNDGTPFNAQAVVTTVQRYKTDPDSTKSSAFESVDSVTAPAPYTVVFHLHAPDSAFIANPAILSPAQLSKLGDDFETNPVCAGPFMFDHRVVGDNVTLIKSPYWYDRGNVFLDKIVYKPMSEPPAAAAALKAGDIQVLDAVSSSELDGVRATPSLRVLKSPQHGWGGIVINLRNGSPLATSGKLRQAFEEAIDRNALNKVVFGGLNQPSCTPIAPTNTPWYKATNVPCTPYNPSDAKKLVAISGFASPTVHLLTPIMLDNPRLAQFIQAQEAAVGINVVVDTADATTATARAMSGDFDAYLLSAFSAPTDPNTFIYQYLATQASANYGAYSNPRLDYVLANALKATSLAARSTLYHVAQQIIAGDRPIIYLYNRIGYVGYSADITGLRLTNSGALQSVTSVQFK